MEPTSLAGAGDRGRDRAGTNRPAAFRAALDALAGVRARPEIVLEHIPAPQRLAPWAHAVGARVAEPDPDGDEDLEIATARFIVLFDPDGHEAWNGTTRCVGYLSAATDEELVDDAMFSEVAWSWLTDALDRRRRRPTTTSAARSPAPRPPGSATSPAPSTPSTSRCAPRGRRRTPTSTGTCSPGSRCSATRPVCRRPGVHLLGPSDRSGSETL